MSAPSPERLRVLLSYDSETGVLRWNRVTGAKNRRAGMTAGNSHSTGYVEIGVDGGVYRAHRVIWALVTGAWPVEQIDHINGAKADNRWANLREVSNEQNQQNQRRAKRHNRSGVLGVRDRGGWFTASIVVAGRRMYLGSFPTSDAAEAAYIAAKRQHHINQPEGV